MLSESRDDIIEVPNRKLRKYAIDLALQGQAIGAVVQRTVVCLVASKEVRQYSSEAEHLYRSVVSLCLCTQEFLTSPLSSCNETELNRSG